MRIHNWKNPLEYEICEYKLSQRSILAGHTRIHTGEKLLRCNVCKTNFSRKSTLITHLQTNTGENPYICEHTTVKNHTGVTSITSVLVKTVIVLDIGQTHVSNSQISVEL